MAVEGGGRRGRRKVAKPRGIQSASTGTTLLKAMAKARGPLHLRELAAIVGMTTSTVYRYLVSYVEDGFVVQDEASGRYDLGPFAIELGTAALWRIDGFSVANETLRAATQALELDGHMSVWGSAGPTVVRWYGRPTDIVVRVHEGTVFSVLGSATGRLFGALDPPEQTQALIATELKAMKPGLDKDKKEIEARFARIRDARLSFSIHGERRSDLDAMSGPVIDSNGRTAFAVTMFGPRGRVPVDSSDPRAVTFVGLLREATARVGGVF